MNEIATFCQSFKKDFTPRPQNVRQPVRTWSEKDVLDGTIVDAYVIILRTRGCSWALSSGCTMCGYFNDSMFAFLSEEDLLAQFTVALQSYKNEKIVKLFTSGSFLDPSEVPIPVQHHILSTLNNTAEKISVESRPEYITEKNIRTIQEKIPLKGFEVGIGLETSNDRVREHAINKGFTFQEYKKAATLLRKHKVGVKTYVLLKPPFLTEKESLQDCVKTAKDTAPFTDLLSLKQDTEVFSDLSCGCQEHWRDQLDMESLSFGSLVDFQRWSP